MSRLRYSLVTRALWSDASFLALSEPEPNARMLWLYLLTGDVQGPIPGLFRAGVGTLADGLGWPFGPTALALEELVQEGLVQVSVMPPLIWLPKAAKHNPPTSPNVVRSWGAAYQELPEASLREEAMVAIRGLLPGVPFVHAFDLTFPHLGKPLPKALGKASPKGGGKGGGKGPKGVAEGSETEGSLGGELTLPLDTSPAGKPLPKPLGKPSPNQEQDPRARRKTSGESSTPHQEGGDRLAKELREAIRSHAPRLAAKYDKPGKLDAWARDLERLLRIDGAKEGEVRTVIRWAHASDFWRPNLLSGAKVRQHFDRLLLQAKAGGARVSTSGGMAGWMYDHHAWLLRWRDELVSLGKPVDQESLIRGCEDSDTPLPEVPSAVLRWLEGRA